ncbi:MAG: phage holin family protein [Acidobacteria bacterium]|nr:phage holin family protein [Acidobacteriota bacterium]
MAFNRGLSERRNLAISTESQESFGGLLGELASQTEDLFRDEIALAKQELKEKLGTFQSALLALAFGAVIALIASLALCAAVIIALAEYVKPWQSALIIGLILGMAAGVFISTGIGRFKRASLRPEQTLQTLEENKEWLREIT